MVWDSSGNRGTSGMSQDQLRFWEKKSGIKNPVFNASNIKGLENVECWNDNKSSEEVI